MSVKEGKSIEELLESNTKLNEKNGPTVAQVWTHDDISPASMVYSYKQSNIKYEWNPYCMTRYLGDGRSLEVMVH